MDNMDDSELMEHHHSHRFRGRKRIKHDRPKKRSGRRLPLPLKLCILLLTMLAILISTSDDITIKEPSATVVHTAAPKPPVLPQNHIPDFKAEDNEKKLEKEDESIEERLWQNRPGAIMKK